MPELPEVEIVRQSLNRQVKNQKILNIQVNNRKLRLKVPKNFEKIFKNTVIENIQRKSKYLILVFDNHLSNALVLSFTRELPGIEAIPATVKPSKIALSFNFLLISFLS